jgi:streptomycin 6-kinase
VPGTQGECVVLHQDFHGGNVLQTQRQAWLAIDPKPLVGEREFDTASLLRDRRVELLADAAPSRRLRRRLDLLSGELGLDRERMRGWAIAHALAWGLTGLVVHEDQVACATLLEDVE